MVLTRDGDEGQVALQGHGDADRLVVGEPHCDHELAQSHPGIARWTWTAAPSCS
jgi:hypothetical protein